MPNKHKRFDCTLCTKSRIRKDYLKHHCKLHACTTCNSEHYHIYKEQVCVQNCKLRVGKEDRFNALVNDGNSYIGAKEDINKFK